MHICFIIIFTLSRSKIKIFRMVRAGKLKSGASKKTNRWQASSTSNAKTNHFRKAAMIKKGLIKVLRGILLITFFLARILTDHKNQYCRGMSTVHFSHTCSVKILARKKVMKQKLPLEKGESGSVRDSASGLTKERLKVLDKMTGQPHREDDEGKFDKFKFYLLFALYLLFQTEFERNLKI